jgi:hypothetical protein
LRRDIYYTLILVAPRYSVAIHLDSGSEAKKKYYTYIKGVLDDALEGYAKKGGDFRAGVENVKDGRHMFKHVIKFPASSNRLTVSRRPSTPSITCRRSSRMNTGLRRHLVSEDGPKSMQGSRMLNLGMTSSASRIRLRLSCKKMSSRGGKLVLRQTVG